MDEQVSIDGIGKTDLSNLLDIERIDDIQGNDKLREFFKKLVETDAQIRLLRKGMHYPNLSTDESEKTLKNLLERSKRSLKTNHTKIGDKKKLEIFGNKMNVIKKGFHRPFNILKHGKNKNTRNKRVSNDSEPAGYFIEKKKVLVQYMPFAETKKIAKCSHAPKDSKSHETLLKHPFYKNTQRLDEMLDQFIAKNLYGIMDDPYALDFLMKKKKDKCKHPQTHKGTKTNEILKNAHKTDKVAEKIQPNEKINEQKISDDAIKKLLEPLATPKLLDGESKKINKPKETVEVKSTSENYEIVLSISTILNPDMNIVTTPNPFGRLHAFRKLMQVDEEDEESIGYEDLNEVLAEDIESHDEKDSLDRKKRDELNPIPQLHAVPNPPGITNPNWKGALPLYPDEINSMIKQAALNANKLVYLQNKEGKYTLLPKDASSEAEDKNDIQYIEEYFNSKYNRLVNMAQAYSDYGVLDGKRNGIRTEKAGDEKILEHRVKLSENGALLSNGLFERLKKSTRPSEGIRFELRPTDPSITREDPPLEMSKLIQKHVKIAPENGQISTQDSSMLPSSKMEFMYLPTKFNKPTEYGTKKKIKNQEDNGFMFSFHRSQRSLMSIKDYAEDNESFDDKNMVDIINEGETGVTLFYNIKAIPLYNANGNDNVGEDIKKNKKRDVKLKERNLDSGISNLKNNISRNDMSKINNITEKYHDIVKTTTIIDSKNNDSLALNEEQALDDSTCVTLKKAANTTKVHNANRTVSNATLLPDDKRELIDIFMLLADFFDSLDDLRLTSMLNHNTNVTIVKRKGDNNNVSNNNTLQTLDLKQNSKMLENFRSRTLLSMDNMTKESEEDGAAATYETTRIIESNNSTKTMNSTIVKNCANVTEVKSNENILMNTTDIKEINKTLVKRSVDDSNLIFWNDIYDDEYGVRVEPEENVRDKHSVPRSPGTWFKDKLKKLTDNLRKKPEKSTVKRRISRDNQRLRKLSSRKGRSVGKLDKRDLKLVEADEFQPDRSFAALNANMKEVCKKAARAVQQTKNLEVKEDTNESAASTTLMQQLVKLMTDLVDYQVQQKTCLQLPPDLQNFLEWLTDPNQESAQDTGNKRDFQDDLMTELEMSGNDDKSTDHYLNMGMVTPTTSERDEIHPEARSDCFGTLRAVQELILKYDELSDEEKIKMSGIKEYLDNQLDYLEKYIVSIDEFNNLKRDLSIRFKRNIQRNNEKRKKTNKKGKIKQRIKNVLKLNNKKHTKTSLIQTTEANRHNAKNHKTKSFVKANFEQKLDPITLNSVKRNLKDVYFKALADSKKVTTVKSYQKYRD